MLSQVTQHLRQGHFRFSGLEAAFHRGFDPVLRFRVARTVEEETGVTPKVFRRRERDRIDSLPDHCKAKRDPRHNSLRYLEARSLTEKDRLPAEREKKYVQQDY